MACTIVSTPATGAADWTGWITQQGLTDRGFMQVSLTNFAASAASSIAAGSIMELAGSIYSCTETAISLAAGTISAAVAVYYVAIPSAGGTTCTFTMDSVAPTWVDAKQGYYASAASTSRYLGGTYIGTAATYYNKWIYQNRYAEKPALRNRGIKIDNILRSTSGISIIADVGFEPSIVFFFAINTFGSEGDFSIGVSNGTTNSVIMMRRAAEVSYSDAKAIYIDEDGSNFLIGHLTSLDPNGFTLSWALTGTISARVIYVALP